MEGSEEDAQSDITAFADRIATVLVESIGMWGGVGIVYIHIAHVYRYIICFIHTA